MNFIFVIPNILLAIGLLCSSISCFQLRKRITALERDVKALTEKFENKV